MVHLIRKRDPNTIGDRGREKDARIETDKQTDQSIHNQSQIFELKNEKQGYERKGRDANIVTQWPNESETRPT